MIECLSRCSQPQVPQTTNLRETNTRRPPSGHLSTAVPATEFVLQQPEQTSTPTHTLFPQVFLLIPYVSKASLKLLTLLPQLPNVGTPQVHAMVPCLWCPASAMLLLSESHRLPLFSGLTLPCAGCCTTPGDIQASLPLLASPCPSAGATLALWRFLACCMALSPC